MSDLKPPLAGYSLWFMLEEEDQRLMQSVIGAIAYDRGLRSFVAHATVIGLLQHTPDQLEMIKDRAQVLASASPAFEVEMFAVGMRNMHFQSVFMPIVPHPLLTLLNQQARTAFGKENDPPFFPHFSGAYGDLERDDKVKIGRMIQSQYKFPEMVRIVEIAVADVHGHPDEWKIIERYPLVGK